jgi:hypothetical protein
VGVPDIRGDYFYFRYRVDAVADLHRHYRAHPDPVEAPSGLYPRVGSYPAERFDRVSAGVRAVEPFPLQGSTSG